MAPTSTSADAERRLDEAFERMDRARTEGLGHAARVQQVQAEGADREHRRLREKYGDDHPRTVVAAARVQAEQALAGAVRDEAERAQATPLAPAPGTDEGVWTVTGRVTDAHDQPLAGYVVSLYDEDLFFDDRLGSTRTGADGAYTLSYRTGDFRDFIERKPDLYLKVLDPRGKTVHTTKAQVIAEAGRQAIIDVRLQR